MKRILLIALSLLMLLSLAACKTEEIAEIRLGGLTGPTTMGISKLLSDNEAGESKNSYQFTLAGSADELTPLFVKGELDILCAPINLGSVLYNKTQGDVQLLAVNTLGVLYILKKGDVQLDSLSDLKGQTVLATGKGSVPEYTLSYLLSSVGVDMEAEVDMAWKSEPAEVVSQLLTMDKGVCMLPQPYVTVALSKVEGLELVFDLTKEWESYVPGKQLITSGVFARKSYVQAHKGAIETFLKELSASVDYLNGHVEESSLLVDQYIGVKAAIAKEAIPYCHIVAITGNEMKVSASAFLQVLYEQKAAAVGGQLPGDDFYYLP